MRKFLLFLLFLIVALSILWILAGRQIAGFVDRFQIKTIVLEPVRQVRYEGTGDGGVIIIGSQRLGLAPLNPHVGSTKDNQLALAHEGKVFALGTVTPSTSDTLEADASENSAIFRQKQSYLPWPTFGQLPIPQLNRHKYFEYLCTARNGQRLQMLWSVDAAQNRTSLIRIEISDATR